MKITVDTSILVRAVVQDDEQQGIAASRVLREAELIAVCLPCLCEFVWVLQRTYKFDREDISAAVTALLGAGNVVVPRAAVDVGLQALDAGGDFADALIAHEGRWLGGEIFVSFDKKAVLLIKKQGQQAKLLV